MSVAKGLPRINGDKARIEQVLLNILSNAVKYTPDGGKIEITGGTTGNKVWIKIKDNGIGIPEEDLSRIFDRFYRVDKARSRESGGTGLGLSIAREIVIRHGGDIMIESAAGGGTTVTIVWPIEGRAVNKRKLSLKQAKISSSSCSF
jgi:two-component system sensor histidine kinase VicK